MNSQEIYDKLQIGDSVIYNPFLNQIYWFTIERIHDDFFTVGVIENRPRWHSCNFLKCPGDMYDVYKIKEEYRRT